MYFAENQTSLIRRAHLDGDDVETLFAGVDGVVGPKSVALDVDAGQIYWTQGDAPYQIRHGSMDGTGPAQVLVTHEFTMSNLVLDLEGGRVYWATEIAPTGVILSANLADGSDVQTWLTLSTPTGALAFDPESRKLYWGFLAGDFSCDLEGKIQRADIDDPKTIEDVVTGLKRVHSITVDPGGAIYWSEICINRIRSADLRAATLPIDGATVGVLVPNEYTAGMALDPTTAKLYWTHPINPDTIQRANAADGTAMEPLIDLGPVGPHGIALVPGNPADLNGDGTVNGIDLAILLGAWGSCPKRGTCAADLNHDGVVNGFDLAMLLGSWGS